MRYLDVMTCRSSNPNAVGSSAVLLSQPLYLSDMSHVDVKLASSEVAGPVNMFYPNGAKSAHMRQKLEDAIWERVALQQAGIIVDALSVGSGEGEFSASGSQSAPAKPLTPPKPERKIFNPVQNKRGILLPKTKPPLYYSRPQGVQESEILIKGARRLEGKLQNLNSPHL